MKTNSKSALIFLALVLLWPMALPLAAQTSTATTTTTTTTSTTTAKTTAATRPTTHIVTRTGGGAAKARAYGAATRLASLLQDMQSRASLSPASWKTLANEAGALADRVTANAGGNAPEPVHNAARETRMHVRELRDAARKEDAAAAQANAGQALSSVYLVIEWSGTAN
jgi:hypothetical protein